MSINVTTCIIWNLEEQRKQCCSDIKTLNCQQNALTYGWFDLISSKTLVHKAYPTVNYSESIIDLRPIMFSSELLTTAKQYTSALCEMIRRQ